MKCIQRNPVSKRKKNTKKMNIVNFCVIYTFTTHVKIELSFWGVFNSEGTRGKMTAAKNTYIQRHLVFKKIKRVMILGTDGWLEGMGVLCCVLCIMLKIIHILKKTSKILIKLSNFLKALAFLEPCNQNKV